MFKMNAGTLDSMTIKMKAYDAGLSENQSNQLVRLYNASDKQGDEKWLENEILRLKAIGERR